jgi:hypothetical protein
LTVQIDDRMEGLVRTTLHAAISRDPVSLRQAISAFPDAATATAGYRLAVTVALVILEDQRGRRPTEAEVRQVADTFAADDDWTGITSDEIVALVSAAHRVVMVDTLLPIERAVFVSYVLAGGLLAAHHRPDEKWWDYLDRIESALEAAAP